MAANYSAPRSLEDGRLHVQIEFPKSLKAKDTVEVSVRCLAVSNGQLMILSRQQPSHVFNIVGAEANGRPCCLIVQVAGTSPNGLDLTGLLDPPHSKDFRFHVAQGAVRKGKIEILLRVTFEPTPHAIARAGPYSNAHVAPYPAQPQPQPQPHALPQQPPQRPCSPPRPVGHVNYSLGMPKRPEEELPLFLRCGPLSCLSNDAQVAGAAAPGALPTPLPHSGNDSSIQMLHANCSNAFARCARF